MIYYIGNEMKYVKGMLWVSVSGFNAVEAREKLERIMERELSSENLVVFSDDLNLDNIGAFYDITVEFARERLAETKYLEVLHEDYGGGTYYSSDSSMDENPEWIATWLSFLYDGDYVRDFALLDSPDGVRTVYKTILISFLDFVDYTYYDGESYYGDELLTGFNDDPKRNMNLSRGRKVFDTYLADMAKDPEKLLSYIGNR